METDPVSEMCYIIYNSGRGHKVQKHSNFECYTHRQAPFDYKKSLLLTGTQSPISIPSDTIKVEGNSWTYTRISTVFFTSVYRVLN
jgi:hypothetical protein